MFFYIITFCVLLANVQGGILPAASSRIVGGSFVTIYDHPYQVALHHRNPSGVFALACGGVILRPNLVLTAAQCTVGTTSNQWQIRAGSSYHSGVSGEVKTVSRIIVHDQYAGFPSMVNDISLVYLSSELPIKDSIQLAKVPYQGVQIPVGTMANVTGWGSTYEGGPTPDVLQRITIPIVDHNRCLNTYAGYVAITHNMLCAGVIGIGGQDFCQKDTGGPLVVDGMVYGIASFGYSCGHPNFPGVYTKVSSYTNWINSNV